MAAARETVVAEEVHDFTAETNNALCERPELNTKLAFQHNVEIVVGPTVLLGEAAHVQQRVGHIGVEEVFEPVEGWLVVLQSVLNQGAGAPCRSSFEAFATSREGGLGHEVGAAVTRNVTNADRGNGADIAAEEGE